ncbi:hypothetical protein GYMLUDRAFT_80191 [Collybiopsis luxurians FD-317 M1]|nr:hypothetical protein GYMLUDRAFT_80191 [Collybiopsis luxurians FD-317 M1]
MKFTTSVFVLAAAAVSVQAVANNAQDACQGITKLAKHSGSDCKFKSTDATSQQTTVTEGFCIPNPAKKNLLHPNGQLECQAKKAAAGSTANGAAGTTAAAGTTDTSAMTGDTSAASTDTSGATMRRRAMQKRRLAYEYAEMD